MLSLEQFWRAFGISGGGLNPQPPLPRYAAVENLLILFTYLSTANITTEPNAALCKACYTVSVKLSDINLWRQTWREKTE